MKFLFKLIFYGFIVMVLGLISLIGPSVVLALIKGKPDGEVYSAEHRDSLSYRRAKHQSRLNTKLSNSSYFGHTKAALIRDIKQRSAFKTEHFEVSKIVFTSEKTKWVAGQKQVHLSFTYQLQYRNANLQQLNGSILLASDANGDVIDTQVEF